ncbi:penicillin-binding protein [Apilactobacillus timberlakei]|uniref:transglycosylase domain-containing protein n=1 Tax=Apilactobacillus timberlakei TaxID=2008380 RepID=UPI00112EB7F0|nr:transglycosylase domain-containing protein [Apilactobacillus timberlakei]TPR20167.1 penicillin-binding protein [Apilactobacillus timberlakei]TPR21885.1 penicillin-binding protein [Apilactobacillus timberlakei]TPR22286.1 penicillin-binding protein [Apilactobacillus timberlakei]TPR24059.1 penicillin-binding protein [Apilactobacillus timberlakei]
MSQKDSKDNTRVQRNQGKYKKSRAGKIIKRTILGVLAFVSLMIIIGTGVFAYYASSAPKITYNSLSSDNSTKIYDNSNHVIYRMGAQNRDYVKSKDIPKRLKDAVVSIEDRRFYKHHGVDPIRILGATLTNLHSSDDIAQGGSTLTQQLVKLSVFSTSNKDRTIKRKSQDAWLALQVERKYSKQKILEFYINKVYMGGNNASVYGMQTASEYYYGKRLNKLSLAQTAMLAGMPQAPVSYNPYNYPKLAKERRDTVLDAMASNNAITAKQANAAKNESIKNGLTYNHKTNDLTNVNEKYVDSYVSKVLQELKSRGYNSQSGLSVHTNLDLSAQKKLYDLANNDNRVGFPNDTMQVGATLVDPKTGAVNAMIGSRKTDIQFGLNRAVQTDRSSGSTAKPLMDYGPALEYLNYPTYQLVHDTPYTYPGTNVQLKDFDYRYQGTITMRKALAESRNIPAIRTLQNVGINNATRFLSSLGMNFNSTLNLQNGIGLYISPEQEAAAYAAFANNGTYHKPYLINRVVTPDNVSHNISSNGVQAMSPSTAFMMNYMLKGVMNLPYGSGTEAKVPGLYEAGKTGTTQYPEGSYQGYLPSYAAMDSWFTGYTQNYSLSVWTGYDHQFQAGNYINAAQTAIAQKIYKYEMQYISQNKSNEDWVKPNDVTSVKLNGLNEYFKNGHQSIQNDSTTNSKFNTSSR